MRPTGELPDGIPQLVEDATVGVVDADEKFDPGSSHGSPDPTPGLSIPNPTIRARGPVPFGAEGGVSWPLDSSSVG